MDHWLRLLRLQFVLFSCIVFLAYSVFGIYFYFTPKALAESIHLTATVPANPDDFQLVLQRVGGSGPVNQDTEITYTLLYGSLLPNQTDLIVLQINWSLGQVADSSGSLVNIASYVPGSATNALGGASPVIDGTNRTITWQISPMPPLDNQLLTWKIKTNHAYTGPSPVNFTVSARLIGPGMEKTSPPVAHTYLYNPPPPTPTPTPTPTPVQTPTPSPTPVVTPTPTPIVGGSPTPTPTPTPEASSSVTPTPTAGPIVSPTPQKPNITPTKTPPPPPKIIEEIIDKVGDIPVVGKPIQNTADKVVDIAQDDGAIVASPFPFIFTIIPAISTLLSLIPFAPWWQLPALLAALFWSKRRRPWGVVYDAVSKQPLDPVILELKDEKGKKYQTISDIYGRYQFLVEPGQYTLKAQKSNYIFPAKTLDNRESDGVYQDLFYGGIIEVIDAEAITYNIPMDPMGDDWNQQQKVVLGLGAKMHIPQVVIDWIFWAGFAWSLLMAVLSFTYINSAILLLYILLVILRVLYNWRQPWGVVYDQNRRPIASAAVSLIDLQNPLVKRPPVITKQSGRYAFLVDQGEYQVEVSLKQANGYSQPIPGPKITISGKQGTISQDIVISDLPKVELPELE